MRSERRVGLRRKMHPTLAKERPARERLTSAQFGALFLGVAVALYAVIGWAVYAILAALI